jgi:hypothetical protein
LDVRKNPIRVLTTEEPGIRRYLEKPAKNGQFNLLTPIVEGKSVTTTTVETLERTNLVSGATPLTQQKGGSCVKFQCV